MTRTFISLELNEALQQFLGDIISRAAVELPNMRWVDPAGIHLTLAFLGYLTDEQLKTALDAAQVAALQSVPFEYRLKGLGIFGSPQQPRVVWIGIEDLPSGKIQGSPIQHVHRVLSRELELRGFELEKQRLQRLLHSRLAGSSSAIYPVNTVCVMKSELSRSGAKYTCLKESAFSKSNSFS